MKLSMSTLTTVLQKRSGIGTSVYKYGVCVKEILERGLWILGLLLFVSALKATRKSKLGTKNASK